MNLYLGLLEERRHNTDGLALDKSFCFNVSVKLADLILSNRTIIEDIMDYGIKQCLDMQVNLSITASDQQFLITFNISLIITYILAGVYFTQQRLYCLPRTTI